MCTTGLHCSKESYIKAEASFRMALFQDVVKYADERKEGMNGIQRGAPAMRVSGPVFFFISSSYQDGGPQKVEGVTSSFRSSIMGHAHMAHSACMEFSPQASFSMRGHTPPVGPFFAAAEPYSMYLTPQSQ